MGSFSIADLALFVFGLPRYVEDVSPLIAELYSPVLDQHGLNATLIFSLGRRVVTFAIVFIIALVIFWRRSDNHVALIVSAGLIVAGANLLLIPLDFRQPGHALQQDIPGVLATLVGYLGLIFEVVFFTGCLQGHLCRSGRAGCLLSGFY